MAKQKLYFWIPQFLTGLRLLAGPLLFLAVIDDYPKCAFCLAVLAGITDWLDGSSARLLKIESKFGQIFDPLADKAFVAFGSIAFISVGKIPLWLVCFIIFRDLFIIAGAIWIKKMDSSYQLRPAMMSKFNTFLQMMLIGWLLLNPLIPFFDFYPLFSDLLIYATLLTTLISWGVYAKVFVDVYRASKF